MKMTLVGVVVDGVLQCEDSRVYIEPDGGESAAKYFNELLTLHLGADAETSELEEAIHKGGANSKRYDLTRVICVALNERGTDAGDDSDCLIDLQQINHQLKEVTIVLNYERSGGIRSASVRKDTKMGDLDFIEMMKTSLSNYEDYTTGDIEAVIEDGCEHYGTGCISTCAVELVCTTRVTNDLTFLQGKLRVVDGFRLETDLPRDEDMERDEDEQAKNREANAALDGIESLLLALVCAGVITQSEDPKVNEALQSAMDAISNNIGV